MADATIGAQRVAAVGGTVAGGAAAGSGGSQRVHGRVWLPVAVSTLVGREQERAGVAERVAQTRLVTLTGSGGCGKTRLALEVAHDVAAGFEHGAWWVELSGVGDPASVGQALADAVGVREEPGRPLVDTLVERLHDRRGARTLQVLHVASAWRTSSGPWGSVNSRASLSRQAARARQPSSGGWAGVGRRVIPARSDDRSAGIGGGQGGCT